MKKLICLKPATISYVNLMAKTWFGGERAFSKALEKIVAYHEKIMKEKNGQ